jgi:hypothetical protein
MEYFVGFARMIKPPSKFVTFSVNLLHLQCPTSLGGLIETLQLEDVARYHEWRQSGGALDDFEAFLAKAREDLEMTKKAIRFYKAGLAAL